MKKGFTLIEIMGVIIIIAIISFLAFPQILKEINRSKNELSDAVKKIIYSASELYANEKSLKKVDGYTYCVTIDELIKEEYLNDKLIDPVTDKEIDKNKYIEIKVYNMIYEYSVKDNCEVYPKPIYIDNSGANKPELYDKMIPVIYENNNWVYADIYSKWYDYDTKEWANAVVLNSGVTKIVGNTISESEIAMMYVWIPRYKYTIFNANNGSVPEQQINVVFESGTAKTGTVTCTTATAGSGSSSENCGTATNGSSTYTHPAFTFGTKELTGIWVGKFENSAPNATTNSVQKVSIKPNVVSWRNATVSNFYQSILNIKTDYSMSGIDSHMMRNMEWGAVAYLTQSKYGRCTSGTCTEVSRNDSSGYYTGRSDGTSGSGTDYSAAGIYQYNTTNGMLASTTGNIYGIYDMSGGAYEYVMGNMVNSSNQFYSSNAGFGTTPPTKYYDSYTYGTDYLQHSRGRLGDATKETLQTYGTGGWYGDYVNFLDSTGSWFIRGGYYGYGDAAGVFTFDYGTGGASSISASRAVVLADDN